MKVSEQNFTRASRPRGQLFRPVVRLKPMTDVLCCAAAAEDDLASSSRTLVLVFLSMDSLHFVQISDTSLPGSHNGLLKCTREMKHMIKLSVVSLGWNLG